MKEFRYTIKEKLGMHARPAGLFVSKARSFPCRVTIAGNGGEADAKQILAVMGLELNCGDELILRTEGEQEAEVMAVLSRFLEENL